MAPDLGPNPWVELDRISRCVSLAVVAAEDQKFSRHFGFDFESLPDAVEDGLRGASTISRQTAKNPIFLIFIPGCISSHTADMIIAFIYASA